MAAGYNRNSSAFLVPVKIRFPVAGEFAITDSRDDRPSERDGFILTSSSTRTFQFRTKLQRAWDLRVSRPWNTGEVNSSHLHRNLLSPFGEDRIIPLLGISPLADPAVINLAIVTVLSGYLSCKW